MAAQTLPKLADVQRLSATVTRILGQNPSPYTLQGTNCYVLGSGPQRLMIDTSSPGVPAYIDLLRHLLQTERCTIDKVVLTHWHSDHVGSAGAVQQLLWQQQSQYPTLHKLPSESQPQPPHTDGLHFHHLRDGEQVTTADGQVSVTVLHTPGHTDDHACLWYAAESALFCGDLLLGHGSGVFEHLPSYLRSLRRVQQMRQLLTVYSAHGDVIRDPAAKVQEYLTHRLQRVGQVRSELAAAAGDGATVQQLLARVYADVREPVLLLGAERNLRQALQVLSDQGEAQVCRSGQADETWLLLPHNRL